MPSPASAQAASVAGVVALLLATLAIVQAPAPFPGAASTPICGAKTIPYQQAAIAQANGGIWIACRDTAKIVDLL